MLQNFVAQSLKMQVKVRPIILAFGTVVVLLYVAHLFVGINVYYKRMQCHCPELKRSSSNTMLKSIYSITAKSEEQNIFMKRNNTVHSTKLISTTVGNNLHTTGFITTKEVEFEDVTTNHNFNNYCEKNSSLLIGPLEILFKDDTYIPPKYDEIASTYPNLKFGGFYPGPDTCEPRNTIAILVPYRDRELHLRYFLHHLHGILQRQQTRYWVFVIEQDDGQTFNKGQLMNAGYQYLRKELGDRIDCFFFHDVDTLSEDDRTLYECREKEVIHLSAYIDRLNYKFCCGLTIGGVVGFTYTQFGEINGFSNQFYGWGGEDDDAQNRILHVGNFSIYRPSENARFRTISHEKDEKNPGNPERFVLLKTWKDRQASDGLNSLNCPITKVIQYPTYTKIYVKPKPMT